MNLLLNMFLLWGFDSSLHKAALKVHEVSKTLSLSETLESISGKYLLMRSTKAVTQGVAV